MNAKNKIEPLLKKYSDNTFLRATINGIPYIGGALDAIMTTGLQQKREERYQYFLDELKNQIEKLSEDKLDYNYLNSEEFYDLFVMTSSYVVNTRIQDKVKAYTKILSSSLTHGFINKTNPEDILNIIKDLTENDILMIKLISNYLVSDSKRYSNEYIVFNAENLAELSEEFTHDFIFIGLLNLLKNSIIIKNAVISAPLPKLSYQTTPLFDIVIEYLRE